MLDLLKDCCNCFLLSLIEKHLNEPIIYYNFSFPIKKRFGNLSSCFPHFSWPRFLRDRVQSLGPGFTSSPTLVQIFSYVQEEKIGK